MGNNIHQYFSILGLKPGASANDIRNAYRKLIQEWHPDRFAPRSLMQTTAEDRTKEINEAYEQLYKKRLYRRYLAVEGKKPAATPASRAAQSTRRAANAEVRARPNPPRPATPQPPRKWWSARGRPPSPQPSILKRFLIRQRKRAIGVALATGLGVFLWHEWPAATAQLVPVSARSLPSARAALAQNVPTPDARARSEFAPDRQERPSDRIVGELIAGDPIQPPNNPRVTPQPHALSIERRSSIPLSEVRHSEDNHSEAFHPEAAISIDARIAELDKGIDEAEGNLETFGIGDSKGRVIAVQGPPDESVDTMYRYGSSLIYFKKGQVSGWSNGVPRLRIREFPDFDFYNFGRFTLGSTRSEVVDAQGQPGIFTANIYYYGASAVLFENDRVVNWLQVDQRLNTELLPSLPFIDIDALSGRR